MMREAASTRSFGRKNIFPYIGLGLAPITPPDNRKGTNTNQLEGFNYQCRDLVTIFASCDIAYPFTVTELTDQVIISYAPVVSLCNTNDPIPILALLWSRTDHHSSIIALGTRTASSMELPRLYVSSSLVVLMPHFQV